MTATSQNLILPLLYKKGSSGVIQVCQIEVEPSDVDRNWPRILTHNYQHHLPETSNITSIRDIFAGKNIGKANETTPYDQAVSEAKSMWERKTKKGYFESLELANESKVFRPMLAKEAVAYLNTAHASVLTLIERNSKAKEYNDKLDAKNSKAKRKTFAEINPTLTLISQPKLDGARCIIHITKDEDSYSIEVSSRNNVDWTPISKDLIDFIESDNLFLSSLFIEDTSEVYLDGEFYRFGNNENIQDIARSLQTREYDSSLHSDLTFIWYDSYYPELPDLPYAALQDDGGVHYLRPQLHLIKSNTGLIRRIDNIDDDRQHTPSVFSIDLSSSLDHVLEDFESVHDSLVSESFEGMMLRSIDSKYVPHHRSENLLKFKKFQDEEFEILRIETILTGKDKDTAMFICKAPNSTKGEFEAASLGTLEYRKQLYIDKDQYVGKMATVKFFEYTKDNIPRFPRVVTIRDYE